MRSNTYIKNNRTTPDDIYELLKLISYKDEKIKPSEWKIILNGEIEKINNINDEKLNHLIAILFNRRATNHHNIFELVIRNIKRERLQQIVPSKLNEDLIKNVRSFIPSSGRKIMVIDLIKYYKENNLLEKLRSLYRILNISKKLANPIGLPPSSNMSEPLDGFVEALIEIDGLKDSKKEIRIALGI